MVQTWRHVSLGALAPSRSMHGLSPSTLIFESVLKKYRCDASTIVNMVTSGTVRFVCDFELWSQAFTRESSVKYFLN